MPGKTMPEILAHAHALWHHFKDDQRTLKGVLGSAWRNYARNAEERLLKEVAKYKDARNKP